MTITDALDSGSIEARRKTHGVGSDVTASREQAVRVLVVAEGADETRVGEEEGVGLVFASGGGGARGAEDVVWVGGRVGFVGVGVFIVRGVAAREVDEVVHGPEVDFV